MPSAASLLATLAAGLASFLAPCAIPLVPAYLSYVGGVALADLADAERQAHVRRRMVLGAVLYVCGFALVFVLLGVGAAGIGSTLRRAGRPLEVVAGVVLVALGLGLAGLLRWAPLARERRLQVPERLIRAGPWGAFPLGIVFGIGWTPCVGPYLGAALSLAAVSGHALEGALLLLAYAVGLGVPFVLLALAGASLPDLGRRLNRLAGPLARGGGLILAALGVVLVVGAYGHLTSFFASISTPR